MIVKEVVRWPCAKAIAVTVTFSCALIVDGARYITLVVVSATKVPEPESVHVTPFRSASLASVAEMGSALPDSSFWSEFGINATETFGFAPHADIASAMRTHIGKVNFRREFAVKGKLFIFIY
jgi:hypothetical protein